MSEFLSIHHFKILMFKNQDLIALTTIKLFQCIFQVMKFQLTNRIIVLGGGIF